MCFVPGQETQSRDHSYVSSSPGLQWSGPDTWHWTQEPSQIPIKMWKGATLNISSLIVLLASMFCTGLIMSSKRKFEVHSNFMSQSIKQIAPGLHSANNLNIVWPGEIYEIAVNWNMRPHEHFNHLWTLTKQKQHARGAGLKEQLYTTLSSKLPWPMN